MLAVGRVGRSDGRGRAVASCIRRLRADAAHPVQIVAVIICWVVGGMRRGGRWRRCRAILLPRNDRHRSTGECLWIVALRGSRRTVLISLAWWSCEGHRPRRGRRVLCLTEEELIRLWSAAGLHAEVRRCRRRRCRFGAGHRLWCLLVRARIRRLIGVVQAVTIILRMRHGGGSRSPRPRIHPASARSSV